jgi:uncharacterized 2Fe-2S/4Fe-4S cluster protein (DUF4445 family)
MDEHGSDHALVVFLPSGRRGRFAIGTPVLQAARRLGVDIDSVCGGRGLCGRCQVLHVRGAFAKHGVDSRAESLAAVTDTEVAYQARRGALAEGVRLSCSVAINGDVLIDVPAASQVHRPVVRKRAEVLDITLDPVVRLHLVEVEPPSLERGGSDLTRLFAALNREWGLGQCDGAGVPQGLDCDLAVLRVLQGVLRAGDWQVTVAVLDGTQVVGIWPGLQERVHGLAVDVGSTTIAAHLVELLSGEVLASSGVMNPQIRFGEDLMSRVSYIMMNPGGDQEQTAAVRAALAALSGELISAAGIAADSVLQVAVVGNPIMQALVFGINPIELGGAPFALASEQAFAAVPAAELGLPLAAGARVYGLPCIAGHVGADAAAVILSEQPHRGEARTLIVDVGTNAEIVLGNRQRLLAASSPTGPAFEGAQISCGQRAAPGAIERVRIDPRTLEPRFRVIGAEAWSDAPDFAEQVEAIGGRGHGSGGGVTGVCGSGIIELIGGLYLAGVIDQDGVIRGEAAARSGRVQPDGRTWCYVLHTAGERCLRITQNDVRAIQLAKAALYAGIQLLMARAGCASVDAIRLAGAFGAHIDVKYAMLLGLIPDCRLEAVSSAGNAAGSGARIALLSRSARREIEAVVRRVEKIETATEPDFQAQFVDAMAIPHRHHPFTHLRAVVALPAPQPARSQVAGRGRRGTRRA